METGTFVDVVNNLGLDQIQNTDKGIPSGSPSIQNVHISLTVCSMEHKNRRLGGPTCIDSHLVPKFALIEGALPP